MIWPFCLLCHSRSTPSSTVLSVHAVLLCVVMVESYQNNNNNDDGEGKLKLVERASRGDDTKIGLVSNMGKVRFKISIEICSV
mgnify:CR=1 FL=1